MAGKRFEVHVLVNAGKPYTGQWAPLPVWFSTEPEAWREVEGLRALDRTVNRIARSYRVVEKPEVVALPTADEVAWQELARDLDRLFYGEAR